MLYVPVYCLLSYYLTRFVVSNPRSTYSTERTNRTLRVRDVVAASAAGPICLEAVTLGHACQD